MQMEIRINCEFAYQGDIHDYEDEIVSDIDSYSHECEGDVTTITLCSDDAENLGIERCHDCEDYLINQDEYYNENGNIICECCSEDYYNCEQCGSRVHCDNATYHNDYVFCCEDCRDEMFDDEEDCYWRASYKTMLPDNKTYNQVPKRAYGIELESDDCIHYESHTDFFSGVHDGSTSGPEIVSAKLYGDEGLAKIKALLGDIKTELSSSCGYHLHVDVSDYDVDDFKRLHGFLVKNEKLFMAIVPASRRTNSYCRPLSTLDGQAKMTSVETFIATLCDKANCNSVYSEKNWISTGRCEKYFTSKRYSWVNFVPVLRQKSVEIRIHAGTFNYEKVANWIRLWTGIVDAIKRKLLKNMRYKNLSQVISSLTISRRNDLIKFYIARAAKFATKTRDVAQWYNFTKPATYNITIDI